jgi:pyruvate dehydrogenase E2 component (dihydrolipoamide acetyltransferase)
MPRLGLTMEEGRVVAWPLAVGARVEKGRTLLVIESEKTEAEIGATASGFLRHVYVPAGETVPCGALLGAITDAADEPFDPDAFEAAWRAGRPAGRAPRAAAARAPGAGPGAAPGPSGARRPAAPAARALARELGLDVERVPGSGPGGRVTREDVRAFAAAEASLRPAADGVRLEVPTGGDGEAVLLLPGFGTDASAFAQQVPALAERFAVWGVNPRGVGRSDAPALERYDVADAAADVAALAPERFHLVGASLGAAVALEAALASPARVRSLTLVTPFLAAGPRLLAVVDGWCAAAAESAPDTLARLLLPWLFSERFLADAAARERTLRGLARSAARVPAATLRRAAAGLRAWSGTRAAGTLAALPMPALVVAAGDDLLTPGAEAVAAALPGARLAVVPGAGHAVGIEAAPRVSELVLEHLAGASG